MRIILAVLCWFMASSAYAQDIFNPASGAQLPGTTTNDNAAAGNVGEYIQSACPGAGSTATVTITIAVPGVITWSGNPFTTACPVVFTTNGALPTGLTAGTTYYVSPGSVSGNNFSVSTTVANALAGTLITTSGTQSGTQTGTAGVANASSGVADCTGIALTKGDWDVYGSVAFAPAASTSVTVYAAGVNTTSATLPAQGYNFAEIDFAPTSVQVAGTTLVAPTQRLSLAATTNVFMVSDAVFTVSTMTSYCALQARRRR